MSENMVNIGSSNGLLADGIKPLTKPIRLIISDVLRHSHDDIYLSILDVKLQIINLRLQYMLHFPGAND